MARGAMQGSLQRSLGSMTFGVVREMNQRAERLAKTALAEREQEFQVPIFGTAGRLAVWANLELNFRVEFVPATGQRDSPYLLPTFTYGYEIETPDPIGVLALVSKWTIDDSGAVIGAGIKVAGWQPGVGGDVAYRGKLHMLFSGFGAPTQTELEDDE